MNSLILSEKICLLAFDRHSGRPIFHNIFEKLEYGIAGGLLITLMQEEKICFDGKKVKLQDPTLTEDPLLNQVLFLLVGSQNNKTIEFWLNQIVLEIRNLSEIILDRLIEKGFLKKEEKQLKFGTKIYYKAAKPQFTDN